MAGRKLTGWGWKKKSEQALKSMGGHPSLLFEK